MFLTLSTNSVVAVCTDNSETSSLLSDTDIKGKTNISIAAKNIAKAPKKEKKERNIQKLAVQFINDPSEKNFGLLCERINWGLRSYIFKIVNDDEATTEVITKTFENIYFKKDQFNPKIAQFSTWMYRIARNNALKYVQEKKSHASRVGVDFEDLYDSTIATEADQTAETESFSVSGDLNMVYTGDGFVTYDKEKIISDLYDASISCIDYLPDNLKVVMHERLVNEKKIDDIAIDNSIPISSVKNWLRKGKVELQNIIKNKYPDLYDMYMEFGYTA